MYQVERVFIGSCCFLAGSAFHNLDVYLGGLILIAWTIFSCTKHILIAMQKMRKGFKRGGNNEVSGKRNVVINGDNNIIEK